MRKIYRLGIILVIISAVCLNLNTYGYGQSKATVTKLVYGDYSKNQIIFQDEDLKKALIECGVDKNNDKEISIDEAKNITFLDLYHKSISNISGLEYFTQLRILNLRHNAIKDLAPLSDITSLEILKLSKNHIRKIDDLEKLHQIESLDLEENEIYNIDIIWKLDKLNHLNLNKNAVKNINYLYGLTKLTYLDLANNQIKELEGIASLDELEYLNLSHNEIKHIRDLEKMTKLKNLDLSFNKIKTIDSLEDMKKLKYLDLSYNEIKDIYKLKELTELETLNLIDNEIEDICYLNRFTKLVTLYLSNNNIRDISSIGELKNLKDRNEEDLKDLKNFSIRNNHLNSKSTPNAIHKKELDFSIYGKIYEVWVVESEKKEIDNSSYVYKDEEYVHMKKGYTVQENNIFIEEKNIQLELKSRFIKNIKNNDLILKIDKASTAIQSKETLKYISSDCFNINLSSKKNAAIKSLGEPIKVIVDLSKVNLKDKDVEQLTAIRYEEKQNGDMDVEKTGGIYDRKTESFEFFTDETGNYTIAEADKVLQIDLEIGNNEALVNGKNKKIDGKPQIIYNRTMVPIGFIVKQMGATVEWNEVNKTVSIELDDKKLEMVIGEKLEGFDIEPIIIGGRTFVPVRYVSEKLGAKVTWFKDEKKIHIVK